MKLLGFSTSRVAVLAVFITGSLMAVKPASAQLRDYLNLPDHDSKRYYLGIGFMYEQSHLQVSAHPKFLQNDSVLSVTPGNTGGFGFLGVVYLSSGRSSGVPIRVPGVHFREQQPHVQSQLSARRGISGSNQ